MKLSILIPTMPCRKPLFQRLIRILAPQLGLGDGIDKILRNEDVEVLQDMDNGEITIGAKRNRLLSKATGDYVVFIDDDDRVTENYVQMIMAGIAKGVDVVCVNAIHTTDGQNPKLVIDIPYQRWRETPHAYLRGVQWRDAVKREIAISVPYPDIRFGEDHAWTIAIEATKIIKSWHEAEAPTYFHEFVSVK
jgi:glycosyltransferase involved in cell wall biosynthesis